MKKVLMIVEVQQAKLNNKDWIFKKIIDQAKGETQKETIRQIAINTISNEQGKYYEKEEFTVYKMDVGTYEIFKHLPIDEIQFQGKIYPFLKTRLSVESQDDMNVEYIFDGGNKELDIREVEEMINEVLDSILH